MQNSLIPAALPTGSFVQGWLAASFTDAQWTAEFKNLTAAGIKHLIVQTTLDETSHPIGNAQPTYSPTDMRSLYPSNIPGVAYRGPTPGASVSPVESILKHAQANGIKVFLGLNLYGLAWFYDFNTRPFITDSIWTTAEASRGNAVADELLSLYKAKYPDAMHGWYWPWEIDNSQPFTFASTQGVIEKMLNTNLDHLALKNDAMPVMISPFFNAALGTPAAYGAVWKAILAGLTHFGVNDILAPQDGVGADHVKITDLALWFSALKAAVATKAGVSLWANTETFQTVGSQLVSAPLSRVASQVKAVAPVVSNVVSFSYSHYDSPSVVNPAFHKAWLAYKQTGALATTPPPAPTGLTAVKQGINVVLTWTANTNSSGDCGFLIARKGVQIGRIEIPPKARAAGAKITFTDTTATGSHNLYEVTAFDVLGNFSAKTPVTGP